MFDYQHFNAMKAAAISTPVQTEPGVSSKPPVETRGNFILQEYQDLFPEDIQAVEK
jgi:hypothetical protein